MDTMELLKQAGAVREGHFMEADGSCSRVRVAMPRLFQRPPETEAIARQLAQLIPTVPDFVAGVGEGSAVLAYELARQMHTRCLHVTRQGGNITIRREYDLPQGAHVLIVEDVLTQGQSVRETVELLRGLRLQISGIAAILDLSDGKACFRFPLYSLAALSRGNLPHRLCPLCRQGIPFTQD